MFLPTLPHQTLGGAPTGAHQSVCLDNKPRESPQRRDLANYRLKPAQAFSSQTFCSPAVTGRRGRGRFPDAVEGACGAPGGSGSRHKPGRRLPRGAAERLPTAQREQPRAGQPAASAGTFLLKGRAVLGEARRNRKLVEEDGRGTLLL